MNEMVPIDQPNRQIERRLGKIIQHGEMEAMLEVLRELPTALETMVNPVGNLPLHTAAMEPAAASMIDFMVQRYPPSLRIRNIDGDTPLELACGQGNESGCEIFVLFTQKWSIEDLWVDSSAGRASALLNFANFASIQVFGHLAAMLLASTNPDIRAKTWEILNPSSLTSDTLLHRALCRQDMDAAQFIRDLVRLGVVPFQHVSGSAELTPFDLAKRYDCKQSMKMLAAAECNPKYCDDAELSEQEIIDLRASIYLSPLTAQLVACAF